MKKILFSLLILLSSNLRAQFWIKVDSIFSPSGINAESFSAPVFADMNNDGKLDLILGSTGLRIRYFENISVDSVLKFREDTLMFASIYANGYQYTNSDYPALADIDLDGDYDLAIGGYSGILFYRNIGTESSAIWQQDTSLFNFLNSMVGTDPKPFFADLDRDNDMDFLVGAGETLFGSGPPAGTTLGFRNIGTPQFPIFIRDDSFISNIADIGLNSYPALTDIDGDNDLDLLLGRDLSSFIAYKNTGSPFSPLWSGDYQTYSSIETSTYWKNPTFANVNGDSLVDLVYGTSSGRIYCYLNKGNRFTPSWQYRSDYFKVIKLDASWTTAALGDYDNDGDLDLISGAYDGRFYAFRNDGNSYSPIFTQTTAAFSSIDVGSYSSPVFVDIDKDGDLDIVSGDLNGRLFLYKFNGTNYTQDPTPFSGIDVGYFSIPSFGDIDGDGDDDLLIGSEQGNQTAFYLNNRDSGFVRADSLISSITFPNYSRPHLVDYDNDGDQDIFVGRSNGKVNLYVNVGGIPNPIWLSNDLLSAELKVKQNAHLASGELDGDGKRDFVIAEYDGNFSFFKNNLPIASSVDKKITQPNSIVLYQNYPNPFNPTTKIKFSIPSDVETRRGVSLRVFDILGREVATLVNEEKPAGEHEVEFNNSQLPSGIYFYQLRAGSFIQTKKMILLR